MNADVVLMRGKVWTVDDAQPQAEALAVWKDRIVAVGDTADIHRLVGPDTQVIDLAGRLVAPGFQDSHLHFPQSSSLRVWLKEAAHEAEFGQLLGDLARRVPPDSWLLGGGWDEEHTWGGRLPTASQVDRYVPDRPAYLTRFDGHSAVVNRLALQQAGISSTTPDPPGGEIVRDPGTQEPTGVLRDNAMGLVAGLIPEPTPEELRAAMELSLAEARRVGITTFESMGGEGDRATLFRLYQELDREGRLTARVGLYWPLACGEEFARGGLEGNFGSPKLRLRGVKGFLDGSLGSSTAWFWEPYLHEPASCGFPVMDPGELKEQLLRADRAHLQIAIHAIGDRAVSELLDIYAAVSAENGPRDRRLRVEHAQHLRPTDVGRFRELGVIASMQPYHAVDDGCWAEGRIGAERCGMSYAWRSLWDQGAVVCFGSDWAVAPLHPLTGLDAAVNRRTLDGKHPEGWFPEQRTGMDEALRAYTRNAAYASFMEYHTGSLKPGHWADLVVLSQDILDPAHRDRLAEAEVVLTMLGGEIVYQQDNVI